MKRVMVRPAKFVLVSDELIEKGARETAASVRFTCEELERSAAAEPRRATVFAGTVKPSRRQVNSRLLRNSPDEASAHRRVALRVRMMLHATTADASSFDVDAWVAAWMKSPLPQLGGKRPAEILLMLEGWEAVEGALESMGGGPA